MAIVRPDQSSGGGGGGSGGGEIGYDQITANVSVTSTTEASGTTVIPGSAHTFDGSPVIATFCAPEGVVSSAGGFLVVSLFEGSTQIGRFTLIQWPASTASLIIPCIGMLRFTPSAGSHTFSVTAIRNSASVTCLIGAGAGGTGTLMPAFLRFTKV